MIKEALKYLMEVMSPANVMEVEGEQYSDRPLHHISYNPQAEPIKLTTLSSLVDYIRSGFDSYGQVFVHVKSPTEVEMYSVLDYERKREHLVKVEANLPSFDFNRFIDHEAFCINLQSKFIDTIDRALLLKFAGTVEAGSVAEYGDDGVTQKATVKTGIASKGEAVVPNPVTLSAYRTFVEVEQPAAEYVFRMKQDSRDNSVMCALFEADGGAWKIEAMKNITDYLAECLKGVENITIIC